MKRIGITQRVDFIEAYSEHRDSLDHRWMKLFAHLGALCFPLPNCHPELAGEILQTLHLNAVVLSGGNTLAQADRNATDVCLARDHFEAALLDECLHSGIPVLGVCRGMQFLNVALGGSLEKSASHIGTRHPVLSTASVRFPEEVNSYHGWVIRQEHLAACLTPLALDAEGHVEAFEDPSRPIRGMMWHPEREPDLHPRDVQFIGELLK